MSDASWSGIAGTKTFCRTADSHHRTLGVFRSLGYEIFTGVQTQEEYGDECFSVRPSTPEPTFANQYITPNDLGTHESESGHHTILDSLLFNFGREARRGNNSRSQIRTKGTHATGSDRGNFTHTRSEGKELTFLCQMVGDSHTGSDKGGTDT